MAIADLAYQRAIDRLATVGFDALSEQERNLVTLWQVEAGVNNGGLVHYYSGASGDLAFYAPEALARVGAPEKAVIVRTANALFGPRGPSRDRKERQRAIKALTPGALTRIDELEKRYNDDPVDVDELVERATSKK
jgi:hypothetical protein